MNAPHLPPARWPTWVKVLAVAGLFLATVMPAYAQTTNALASLRWFVGSWHCAGQFPNGKPIYSRETFTMELDGHWLRMRHADEPPNRYGADAWWGYDSAAGRLDVTIFDNAGGIRHFASTGWVGNTLTLQNTAASGYVDRFIFQRSGDAQYRTNYAHKDDRGTWKQGDELECRRAPPAPIPQ